MFPDCPPPEPPIVYMLEYDVSADAVFSVCPVDGNDVVYAILPDSIRGKHEVEAACAHLGGTIRKGLAPGRPSEKMCADIDHGFVVVI